MIKVKEEELFLSEKSKNIFSRIDFGDTFSTTNHLNNIEEISKLILNTSPKWVESLFKIRAFLVKLIGLKSKVLVDFHEQFKVGGYIKIFKIYNILHNEIILGANDSHLNFRLIIHITSAKTNNIKVTTLVEFKNTKGKIYMKLIKPFHKLILIHMVKNAYSNKIQNINSTYLINN